MTVIEYVTEEVERQGHNTLALDGIERVTWMLRAWCFALRSKYRAPTVDDLVLIGRLIEPIKNEDRIRRCGVRVGSKICPDYVLVPGMLDELWARSGQLAPLEFYRELLTIHPFVDGNGRSGKVILNWLNGTLLSPIFPPDDFWGSPIRNP